jgi:fatty acid-binding protein DegV
MRAEPSRMLTSAQQSPSLSFGVVTDAAADVPAVERHDARWFVVPETWHVEGGDVPDTGEPERALIRQVLRDPQARAYAPTVEAFSRAYAQAREGGATHIWSVHSSSHLSPAAAAAREAAAGDTSIAVVSTGVVSIGVGLLARRVLQLAAAGQNADAIDAYVRHHAPRVQLLVVPDRFDPAGRRRFSAERLLAGLPLLSAQDGAVARSRRLRTRRATVSAIEHIFDMNAPEEATIHMAVGHGDAAGAVDPFLDILERLRPAASIDLVGRIGPRIVQEIGSRCIGVAWIVEDTELHAP